MTVTLIIHEETANHASVWWAEAPDLPGFSVADETLPGLLSRSRLAIEEILEERGVDPSSLDLGYSLAATSAGSEASLSVGKR